MAQDVVLGNYGPESVDIVISVGQLVHVITGYADGTFVNVSRITPASELYVGSDLSAFRVKRRNKASPIDLTLHQASASNQVLQALQRADEEDDTDTWVFAITIKDNSGQTLFSSSQAFIATIPDTSLSSTAETRNWQIQAVSLSSNVGGNTRMDASTVAALSVLGEEVPERWRLQQ